MNKMEKRLLVITMCVAMAFAGAWGVAKAAGNSDGQADRTEAMAIEAMGAEDTQAEAGISSAETVDVNTTYNNTEPGSVDAKTIEAKSESVEYTAEPETVSDPAADAGDNAAEANDESETPALGDGTETPSTGNEAQTTDNNPENGDANSGTAVQTTTDPANPDTPTGGTQGTDTPATTEPSPETDPTTPASDYVVTFSYNGVAPAKTYTFVGNSISVSDILKNLDIVTIASDITITPAENTSELFAFSEDNVLTIKSAFGEASQFVVRAGTVDYTISIQATNIATDFINIKDCTISFVKEAEYVYTGGEITPEITVRYATSESSVTLVKGTDYTVSYDNNVNAGDNSAVITITGKGVPAETYTTGSKYYGTDELKFTIKKAATVTKAITGKTSLMYNGREQELISVSATGTETNPNNYITYNVVFTKAGSTTPVTEAFLGTPLGTEVGTYVITYAPSTNYDFDKTVTNTPVTVTIERVPATITVIGDTKTVDANGSEQSVEGYTFKSISYDSTITDKTDLVYRTSSVSLAEGSKAYASGTTPNTYYMKLKGGLNNEGFADESTGDFVNKNTNFKITFKIYSDGYIKINSSAKEMDLEFVDKEYTFDGNVHAPELKGTKPSGAKVGYSSTKDGSYGNTLPSDYKYAGDHIVYVKVTADGYEDFTDSAYVTINPRKLTLSISKTFTASTLTKSALMSAITISNKVSSAPVSIKDLEYDEDDKSVGKHEAYNIEISDDDNYELSSDSLYYTITSASSSSGSSSSSSSSSYKSSSSGTSSSSSSSSKTTGSTSTSNSSTTGTTSKSTTGSTTSKTGSTTSSSSSKNSTTGSTSSLSSLGSNSSSSSSLDDEDLGTTGDDPLGMSAAGSDSSSSFDSDDTNDYDYEDEDEEEEEDDEDMDDEDWDDDWDEDSYEVDYDEYDTEGMMTYGRAVHLADPDNHAVIIWILIVAVGLSIIAGIVFLVISNLKEKSKL